MTPINFEKPRKHRSVGNESSSGGVEPQSLDRKVKKRQKEIRKELEELNQSATHSHGNTAGLTHDQIEQRVLALEEELRASETKKTAPAEKKATPHRDIDSEQTVELSDEEMAPLIQKFTQPSTGGQNETIELSPPDTDKMRQVIISQLSREEIANLGETFTDGEEKPKAAPLARTDAETLAALREMRVSDGSIPDTYISTTTEPFSPKESRKELKDLVKQMDMFTNIEKQVAEPTKPLEEELAKPEVVAAVEDHKDQLNARVAYLKEQAKKYDGLHEEGPGPLERLVRWTGKGYNKLPLKARFALGAGLWTAGITLAPISLPLAIGSLFPVAVQRFAGFSSSFLKNEKKYIDDKWGKEKAMAKAMFWGPVMATAFLALNESVQYAKEHNWGDRVDNWLSRMMNHRFHPTQIVSHHAMDTTAGVAAPVAPEVTPMAEMPSAETLTAQPEIVGAEGPKSEFYFESTDPSPDHDPHKYSYDEFKNLPEAGGEVSVSDVPEVTEPSDIVPEASEAALEVPTDSQSEIQPPTPEISSAVDEVIHNPHGFDMPTNEFHIYGDATGKHVFVYGGEHNEHTDQKWAAIAEYLKKYNPQGSVYELGKMDTGGSGHVQFEYRLDANGHVENVVTRPVKRGLAALFSSPWKSFTSPLQFKKFIQ